MTDSPTPRDDAPIHAGGDVTEMVRKYEWLRLCIQSKRGDIDRFIQAGAMRSRVIIAPGVTE